MPRFIAPLAKPKPDAEAFIKAVTTTYEPPRPRMVEYLINAPVMTAVLEMIGRKWVQPVDRPSAEAYWDNFIAFWHHMGYDFVRMELGLGFKRMNRPGGDHGRAYAETAKGPIQSWDDFHQYPWPDVSQADLWAYEYVAARLPEGMGLIVSHGANYLEHMEYLVGYEPLCMMIYDQPDLLEAIVKGIGERITAYYERLLQLPRLIAIFPGDDMGFRTGTLIAPDDIRKYVLPWHKKVAAMTHAKGLPYFLHSCGQISKIIPDLIDDVKIDARHSFEEAITPVADFKKTWGSRLGVLGGVDIDRLTRLAGDDLRKYVRKIIDDCAPGGRFAIGSGNSIPDYIPVENYLTMIDEILR